MPVVPVSPEGREPLRTALPFHVEDVVRGLAGKFVKLFRLDVDILHASGDIDCQNLTVRGNLYVATTPASALALGNTAVLANSLNVIFTAAQVQGKFLKTVTIGASVAGDYALNDGAGTTIKGFSLAANTAQDFQMYNYQVVNDLRLFVRNAGNIQAGVLFAGTTR